MKITPTLTTNWHIPSYRLQASTSMELQTCWYWCHNHLPGQSISHWYILYNMSYQSPRILFPPNPLFTSIHCPNTHVTCNITLRPNFCLCLWISSVIQVDFFRHACLSEINLAPCAFLQIPEYCHPKQHLHTCNDPCHTRALTYCH